MTLQSMRNWWPLAFLLVSASSALAAGPVASNECTNPPPGTIFCEDFEGNNPKGNFDDYDGNPDTENQIVTDPGPSGDIANKVIRFRIPAGQGGGSDLIKVLPNAHDRLYARWYFRYEPGFNFGALNHGGGLAAGDRNFLGQSGTRPSGDDFASFTAQYQENTGKPYAYSYYRGMYQQCSNPQGSCWGDSLACVYDTGGNYCTKPQHRPLAALPALQAGQWYCIEKMVDMGTPSATGTTANGHLSLWLNGQNIGDFPDLWIRTVASLKLQTLWLTLYHHDGTHSTVGEMIDNAVVSTQRIGCGANQPLLSPPTNLRVIS